MTRLVISFTLGLFCLLAPKLLLADGSADLGSSKKDPADSVICTHTQLYDHLHTLTSVQRMHNCRINAFETETFSEGRVYKTLFIQAESEGPCPAGRCPSVVVHFNLPQECLLGNQHQKSQTESVNSPSRWRYISPMGDRLGLDLNFLNQMQRLSLIQVAAPNKQSLRVECQPEWKGRDE